MKIIVLGSQGNLGQQIVKVFSENNEQDKEVKVIGWDKAEIDIFDKVLLAKKVFEIKPDFIINATAYNKVDACEDNDDEYNLALKLNKDVPADLADLCLENNITLVHFSSDYVFNGDCQEGYKEDAETNPINKYGETKLAGEKEIIKFSGKGLKYYIIRTSKLFGPKGASEFSKPSFFDLMLNLSKDKEEIEVIDEEVSCFTYTPDLALGVKKILFEDNGYGIYHLTNSGGLTWYEAAKEFFRIKNININIIPISSEKFNRSAKRPKYSVLLNTKTEQLRDWRECL